MILSDGFPSNETTAATDGKTRWRAKSEKFKLSTVGNGVTKLTTPARIAKSCEIVAFGKRRRGSIGIGFLVVMIEEGIEGLKRICDIQVE